MYEHFLDAARAVRELYDDERRSELLFENSLCQLQLRFSLDFP